MTYATRQDILEAISSRGSQYTYRGVVERFVWICDAFITVRPLPHAVIGQTERPGELRMHFLSPPDVASAERMIDVFRTYTLPAHVRLDVTWAWCLKHTDCREHEALARACYEANA